MCSGTRKLNPQQDESQKTLTNSSVLLELASSNDVSTIKKAYEIDSTILSKPAPWYCRSATGTMGFADRTPLMIAALYGSGDVLAFISDQLPISELNRPSYSDGATALHLAASGGSPNSVTAVKILIDASADIESLDHSGRRPGEVIPKQTAKTLEVILKSPASPQAAVATSPEKRKEYPPDLTLPDIKNGIYSTDEFRMYHFKVKPCSRAYTHDWTECPFVHPGENARRRDPRKYLYTCVPCPEFRKGTCRNGDNCEYAHGVFECWLHPAQYRTRLCKDETGCSRRVCFFAHKKEELRSVNPTAAAMMLSSLSPMSPSAAGVAAVSSAMASSGVWMNQTTPTALQLPSSRLKATMSARDLDVDFELLGLEGYKQKLLGEIQGAAAAAAVNSPRANWSSAADYSSLTQQLLSGGYSGNLPSSPTLKSSSSFGLDHSSMAKAIMNARSASFAQRSLSFSDRGAASSRLSTTDGLSTAAAPATLWGSPDGKLDWGMQGDELNKLRKSTSFAYRNNTRAGGFSPPREAAAIEEPDVSWVHSLVKDGPGNGQFQMSSDMFSPWGEEQMVA